MFNRSNARLVAGVFWITVGAAFSLGSLQLDIGTAREPGPGFVPLLISIFVICLSLASMVTNKEELKIPAIKNLLGYPAVISASVLSYLLLIKVAHFLLSTFLLMLVVFAVFFKGESSGPARIIFYAIGTALASWLIFSVGLKMPFP